MKIKPEHVEQLQALVQPFHSAELLADYAAQGLSPMRYRWDLLWRAPNNARFPVMDAIYQYANDTHIDTALRQITGTR